MWALEPYDRAVAVPSGGVEIDVSTSWERTRWMAVPMDIPQVARESPAAVTGAGAGRPAGIVAGTIGGDRDDG